MTPLLSLLHLTDSLFPIGSFAHSDGLEAATQEGTVSTAADLSGWLDVCLTETVGKLEGPAVAGAWSAIIGHDLDRLLALDAEVTMLRPALTARRASRAMGLRLLTNWRGLHASPLLDEVFALTGSGSLGPALPVAFGIACAAAGVDRRSSVEAYAYSRLAATVSAAMRLMSIGQTDAHRALARALKDVPIVIEGVGERPESFAPAMDIAAMNQQYLHSRLFLS